MTADFAAIITDTIREGRALAESLMTASCTITRLPDARGTLNQSTGKYDPPVPTIIYAGKCRMQVRSVTADGSAKSAGERQATVQQHELHLPVVGTENVAAKDIVTIISASLDDALTGRTFTIVARHEKSQATARRLPIVEVTG